MNTPTPEELDARADAIGREIVEEETALARDARATSRDNQDMHWYYKVLGGHTHVRVFMNGGKCGDLCFRNEEFRQVRAQAACICFHEDDQ